MCEASEQSLAKATRRLRRGQIYGAEIGQTAGGLGAGSVVGAPGAGVDSVEWRVRAARWEVGGREKLFSRRTWTDLQQSSGRANLTKRRGGGKGWGGGSVEMRGAINAIEGVKKKGGVVGGWQD